MNNTGCLTQWPADNSRTLRVASCSTVTAVGLYTVYCLLSPLLSIDCCCVLLMFIVWRAGSLKSVVYQPNVLCCYTLTSDLEKYKTSKISSIYSKKKTQDSNFTNIFKDYSNRSFRQTFWYSYEYKGKIGGTPGVHYNLLFPISCNGRWSVSVRVPIVYSVTLTLRSQIYIVGAGSTTGRTCSE